MLILSQVLKKLLYLPFFTLISSFLGMGKLDGCIALFTLLASIAIVMLPSGFGAAKMFEIHRTGSFIECSSISSCLFMSSLASCT